MSGNRPGCLSCSRLPRLDLHDPPVCWGRRAAPHKWVSMCSDGLAVGTEHVPAIGVMGRRGIESVAIDRLAAPERGSKLWPTRLSRARTEGMGIFDRGFKPNEQRFHGYLVLDFETTGFCGRSADRVVEVGVVSLDPAGQTVDEWATLVNPERDVSAGYIHGITARDVYAAPRFAEIAGLLSETAEGRVLVAHNLTFEAQFLLGEFARLGCDLGLPAGICTMRLAAHYLPAAPRNLLGCCAYCGYEVEDAHSALADARAAAHLLREYMSADAAFLARWAEQIHTSLQLAWPVLPADRSRLVGRSQGVGGYGDSYVARLAARLPAEGGSWSLDSYLEVLDRALIDRILTLHEIDELVELASSLGLSQDQVHAAHRRYVEAMLKLARSDGIITAEEMADLRLLTELLGLSAESCLADVRPGPVCAPERGDGEAAPMGGFALTPGDRVAFTGEADGCDRDTLETEARALGLRPTGSVSRHTRVVVAADPDSLSGKARKAREVGVPIIDFAAYERLVGGLRSACQSQGDMRDGGGAA